VPAPRRSGGDVGNAFGRIGQGVGGAIEEHQVVHDQRNAAGFDDVERVEQASASAADATLPLEQPVMRTETARRNAQIYAVFQPTEALTELNRLPLLAKWRILTTDAALRSPDRRRP
jgi:hypothetical protein